LLERLAFLFAFLYDKPPHVWNFRFMKHRNLGFTLVELLVVIAIIGVLVSMLLPAVQMARESGRRSQCMNNLKQLSLACTMHESTHKTLPTGGWSWYWSGDPDRGFTHRQPGGWTYVTLPFLEQQALFDLGTGKTVAQKKPEFAKLGRTPIAVHYCPTRRPVRTYFNEYNNCNSDPITEAARSDYAANAGTDTNIWWTAPNSGDPSFADVTNPDYAYPFKTNANGVIYTLSTLEMSGIRDGLSNTYLLGEKYLNPNNWDNGKAATDNNPLYSGFDWDNVRWSDNGVLRDRKGLTNDYAFGSSHTGGVNMAYCDGSVRAVNFAIDKNLHIRLCNRKDGQVTGNTN
jgi:prepilin-type N-terminal cleavage/methylation domain-containing protein/prepilin-type processing-associated H-X9-DG protein